MNWRIKGVVQKTLSVLPGGTRVNDLLQRTVGGLRHLDANIAAKVNYDWAVLVGHMTGLGRNPRGLRYLEIGTGWYPTSPACHALAGAGSCVTYDVDRHLDPRLTFQMLDILRQHLPAIARAAQRPLPEVEAEYERLRRAQSLEEFLRAARIEYHAPADACATGLPDDSVDVVFSNSVLEHVPGEVIARLMRESRRVLRPGGLSIHSANCGDHYAYFDRRITALQYLAYSDSQWRFWNNRLQYQNRLRPVDFIELAESAGLKIVLRKHAPRPDLLAALPRLKIAPEFRSYPPEQLCCTSVDFVGRKD